jgi:hypothetical protein
VYIICKDKHFSETTRFLFHSLINCRSFAADMMRRLNIIIYPCMKYLFLATCLILSACHTKHNQVQDYLKVCHTKYNQVQDYFKVSEAHLEYAIQCLASIPNVTSPKFPTPLPPAGTLKLINDSA